MKLFLFGVLPYLAAAVLVGGIAIRIGLWLKVPVPFQLTLFPAPEGSWAKVRAVACEMLLFPALYREKRGLWGAAFLFHLSLLMVLSGHLLGIYFLRGQFVPLGASPQQSLAISRCLGALAGALLALSVVALGARRGASRDLRLLTGPGEWCSLLLLLGIALSGLCMYLPGWDMDLPAVRGYLSSLVRLAPGPIPKDLAFAVHFFLALCLCLYFPLSRLMHAAAFLVVRSILLERAPIFPTPGGKKKRSRFAEDGPSPKGFGAGGGRGATGSGTA